MGVSLIFIYTDGACSGNPGPGGWGAVLEYGDKQKCISGFVANTTNNRMELAAAIESLRVLKKPVDVKLHTDSKYVQQGITNWIIKWKRNNWQTSAKKPVKNLDLWQDLDELCGIHNVEWCWVKGHAGVKGNELADTLAREAVEENMRGK
jgi:ribonuclease HI